MQSSTSPQPSGPYQVYETADQLGVRYQVSAATIERMEKRRDIPQAHIRSKPEGSGRGRAIKRWDVWLTSKHLHGDRN
jgi:hypothetical protein